MGGIYAELVVNAASTDGRSVGTWHTPVDPTPELLRRYRNAHCHRRLVDGSRRGTGAAPQGPTQTALAATKIEKVKDNLYVITGSDAANLETFSGGNTAVFITDAGVTVVDTKLPGWGQVLLDRIKTVTSKPVTTIINTHTHGDHTGSNEFFGTTVERVVHENTKANMAKMEGFKGDKAAFLPKRIYRDKLSLGKGRDQGW